MNNEIQHQFKHVSHLLNSLDNIINKYKLEDKKNTIYKVFESASIHCTHILPYQGKILDLFQTLYILKHSSNVTIKGIAKHSDNNLDIIKNDTITTELTNLKLKNLLISTLESKIDNETKDYYINREIAIIKPTSQELEYESLLHKLHIRFDSKKITKDELCKESEILKETYKINEIENRYREFFSIENLGRIIKYEKKINKTSPKHKNQLLGEIIVFFIQHYKYEVFGYQHIYIDYIEAIHESAPLPCKGNEEILKKHTTDSIEKEIDTISKDEEKSATMCKSERYNFIYDLLILLGLIKEEEKGRKEKSRFIGDCLKAYYKITTEQKKYLR